MRQKLWRTVETCAFSRCDGLAQVLCVPVDNDRGQQVEPSHAVMLTLGGVVTDFALSAYA